MKTAASLFIVILLVSVAFTQNSRSKVQQPLPETYKIFPPGEWTFSAHPFMGKGFDTRPVVVTSVKTDLATFSVVAIRIRNISSKSVTGVSFKWSLTNEKNPKVTLKEGETPLGNVGQELASTHESILTVPVFSFLDIHKKFVKKGRLEGNFRVDIAVSRLLFSDGTFWNEGQAIVISPQYFGSFVKAAYFERSGPLQVSPFTVSPACAKQRCVHGGGPPPGYSYGSSEADEFCTNCSHSCCNTICGAVPACNCN